MARPKKSVKYKLVKELIRRGDMSVKEMCYFLVKYVRRSDVSRPGVRTAATKYVYGDANTIGLRGVFIKKNQDGRYSPYPDAKHRLKYL